MARGLSDAAAQEWRAHWKLVLAGSVGASMSGIILSALGAYIVPLEQSLHWTRSQITSGLFFYAVIGVVCAPLYGRIVDRVGPRRLAVPGVLVCGSAVALFSTATGSTAQWLALWLIYALAAQICKPLTWTAAVSSEFEASRGLALGITMIGGTIGGIVAPIVANHLIGSVGWRSAFVFSGLGWGGIAFVFCYFFFFGRSDRLRLRSHGTNHPTVPLRITGMTAREGFSTSRFWRMVIITLLSNSLGVGLLIHMIPLLESTGMPAVEATWLVGLSYGGGVLGALVVGALVDRMAGNILGGLSFGLPALAYAWLLVPSDSVASRVFPVLLLTFVGGSHTHLYSYLTTRYFGLRAYGTLFGVIAGTMSLGVGMGPVIGSFIFDRTHSYDLFLIIAIPVAIFNGLMVLSLGRYPDFSGEGGAGAKPAEH